MALHRKGPYQYTVKKDVIIFIEHIQQAIERIQGYTHGQTEAGFLSNTLI